MRRVSFSTVETFPVWDEHTICKDKQLYYSTRNSTSFEFFVKISFNPSRPFLSYFLFFLYSDKQGGVGEKRKLKSCEYFLMRFAKTTTKKYLEKFRNPFSLVNNVNGGEDMRSWKWIRHKAPCGWNGLKIKIPECHLTGDEEARRQTEIVHFNWPRWIWEGNLIKFILIE